MSRAVLLIHCPDQKGLVSTFTQFVAENGGNIIHSDHHTDSGAGVFLNRIEWDLEGFKLDRSGISKKLDEITGSFNAHWTLRYDDRLPRVALFVGKQDHCLVDLLWRNQSGELKGEISIVISNHETLKSQCERFGVAFKHIPVEKGKKAEAEADQIKVLNDHKVNVVVLAKYMQIVSAEFIKHFPETINIHHSFLPSFAGAKPYHRAFERGVKLIGATAHYVTQALDEGPIIEQDVHRVTHRHQIEDLVRIGKDLEKIVLARALRHHLENRVLVYNNKTVVF